MDQTVQEKAKRVKMLLLDVDGVLTDGRIVYDSRGRDMKFFDVHDGMGVYLMKKAGIPTILITAKNSRAIRPRARDMQVEAVFADVSPKSVVLGDIFKKYGIGKDDICFIGDDLVDLCMMRRVGFPVAVSNACAEIKDAAAYVTAKAGGRGAVREVIEIILKSQDKWRKAMEAYDL
jgi:3-deoxy-D-manno-octulosonate 8-phosphate phosphatase (KDO 8-P phosphatase)